MKEEQTTRTHELKTWPSVFRDAVDGIKTFEIRKNDRDFAIGDTLVLKEFDPAKSTATSSLRAYTGEEEEFIVTYMIQGRFGLPPDICVMGIKKIEDM
jgi:hypothetical protein